jgi:predicted nucleotidyltransferase
MNASTVSLAAIRRFARKVAKCFEPDVIVLFGSHAYGEPGPDSDVDLLVVMPTRNQCEQAIAIRFEFPASFPLDLIVRTPKNVARSVLEGDGFISDIMARGKVLHEKGDARVGSKSRGRLSRWRTPHPRRRAAS